MQGEQRLVGAEVVPDVVGHGGREGVGAEVVASCLDGGGASCGLRNLGSQGVSGEAGGCVLGVVREVYWWPRGGEARWNVNLEFAGFLGLVIHYEFTTSSDGIASRVVRN